jgi:glucokinase
MTILAGDVGGTKTRLALFDGGPEPLRMETYRTAEHGSLVEIVGRFLNGSRADVVSAAFGVAAPVANGAVSTVNLPWPIYAHELVEVLELPSVSVVNDLEANARGVELLGADDLAVLNPGERDPEGACAVVSAGTGLGEAALVWDGTRYRALAGEGGHADFAPRSETEIALYRFLAREYGHVSYERVCSGMGLTNIYRFLGGDAVEPAAVSAEAAADPTSRGRRALDLFVSIYGARAGNVALSFMATGGVFLGGGIAPKIVDDLRDGGFMRAFVDKGRFAPLLSRVPVHVVLNDHAALLGAARIATERARSLPTH